MNIQTMIFGIATLLPTICSANHTGLIITGKIQSFDQKNVEIADQYASYRVPRNFVLVENLKEKQEIRVDMHEQDLKFVTQTPLNKKLQK